MASASQSVCQSIPRNMVYVPDTSAYRSQICFKRLVVRSCEISYWDFHFRLQVMKCGCRPEQFLHDHWHSPWKLNSLWLAYHFSSRELLTTETELVAMAILAIHGCRVTPMGTRNPAAIGIPTRLYTTAQMKFIRILLTVRLERSMAATTSIRLSCEYWVVSITRCVVHVLVKFIY